MHVYRIESLDNGRGPYVSLLPLEADDAITELCQEVYGRNPDPVDDGVFASWDELQTHQHYIFGCESLVALLVWFPIAAVDVLLKHDYVIAKYEVNAGHVRMGERQLAFAVKAANQLALFDYIPGMDE